MGIKVAVTDAEDKNKTPWWWRKRIGLTPFYFGFLSAVSAGASFLLSPGQVALVVVALAVVAGAGAERKWGRKKDKPMRNFVWAVIGAYTLFVLSVRNNWLDSGWIFVALIIGVLGLGSFWWVDNKNIHKIEIQKDMERWPQLAKTISMPQVRRGPVKQTETGREWMFYWNPGDYTLQSFMSQARQLESALGIPEKQIRFRFVFEKPGMKNPNAIIVTENTQSKNLEAPVKFDRPTMKFFTDEMYIGDREDSTKHKVCWYHKDFGGMHTLAAGSTGSGKSGLYNLVLAESAYCPDLVRWGIDAKGGMALRPWASLFDWMIDDVDDGAVYWMLSALASVLKARSKYAADRGWNCWKPDKDHPVLLLVVDEAAEVFGIEAFDLNALSNSIARMGRAAGVLLLIATQNPTNEAIGSTQLTKNLRRRFCFSVEDEHAQRIIIPKSSGRFDASDIPISPDFVGTYYSSEGGQINDLSGRVRYVTQHDIYRIVLEVGAPNSPVAVSDLDELSQKAAREAAYDEENSVNHYDGRRIWTVLDAMAPEGWVEEGAGAPVGAEPQVQGGGAPAPAPAPPAAPPPVPPAPTAAPAHAAMGVPPQGAGQHDPGAPQAAPVNDTDTDDDEVLPWSKEDPTMDLNQIIEPTSAEEQAELDAAIAAYNAQHAETDVSAARAIEILDEMLDRAGANGMAIRDFKKGLVRSSSWYSDKLAERVRAGKVVKSGSRYGRPGILLAAAAASAEAQAEAEEQASLPPSLRLIQGGEGDGA